MGWFLNAVSVELQLMSDIPTSDSIPNIEELFARMASAATPAEAIGYAPQISDLISPFCVHCESRHCERSEAIHLSISEVTMDCFASLAITAL
jgi:hypothetical protein